MNLKHKKKMVFVAAALLIVCTILLVSSSFAWIALSRAPEISGISTNIGSNGSLEIALVNTDSYIDPSSIRTKVGGSLENGDPLISNLQWGSVLDLSDSSYGLHDVTLIPARLQVDQSNVVGTGLLSIPDYGLDGRFSGFSNNTLHGSYRDDSNYHGSFVFSSERPEFGVRGIGSVVDITPQRSALTQSRIAIQTYHNSAISAFKSYWESKGSDFLTLLHWQYGSLEQPEDQFAMETLDDTAIEMLVVLDYIDSAYRHGILGFASIMISDETQFNELKSVLLNKQIPLSAILTNLPTDLIDYLPFNFESAVTALEACIANMYEVQQQYQAYLFYGYADPGSLLDYFLDRSNSFFNGEWLYYYHDSYYYADNIYWTDDNVLSVEGSNSSEAAFNLIPSLVGDFNAFCQYQGTSVEFESIYYSDESLEELLWDLDAYDSDYHPLESYLFEVQDVYGFAIDMAFRCNSDCDLLLQTSGTADVAGDSAYLDNQGAGSYMRFNSEQMSERQILSMMDAIRIGFLDNQNNLLGVAKLNTSNYESTKSGITVPLYLYEYTVQPDGSIITGERRSDNSVITSMHEDEPMVISAVVWLDGDYVDNSLAAIRDQSMNGVLNLQFASSADLRPAFKDDPEATEPEGTKPDGTLPEETQPSEPVEYSGYYLSADGVLDDETVYTLYKMDPEGNRDYELVFTGVLDELSANIVINHVLSYGNGHIVIPAVVTEPETSVDYSVSLNPNRPFSTDGDTVDVASISFVSICGKMVTLTDSDMSYLFGNRKDGQSDIDLTSFDGSGLDTSNVTNMAYLFRRFRNLEAIDVSDWDTSNVTNMEFLFSDCHNLKVIDVSDWNTSNVTNMNYLFANCQAVTQLNTTSWDTSNVTKMAYMFNWCSSLTELNASGLDTGNVTTMQGMFSSCTALKDLDVSGMDTSSVTNMMEMFHMCTSLEALDVSHFDTSSTGAMSFMFSYCKSLGELDLSSWNTSQLGYTRRMFYDCNNLTQLLLPEWDLSNADTHEMFTGCPAGENLS